jgi:hypothetical protein
MKKKAARERRKQGVTAGERRQQGVAAHVAPATVMQQLVLPIVVGVEATKNGLLPFVHQMGLLALQELLALEADAIAGPHLEALRHNAPSSCLVDRGNVVEIRCSSSGPPRQAVSPGSGPVHTPGMPKVLTSPNPIALQIDTRRLLWG